jgi:hypothetical protein
MLQKVNENLKPTFIRMYASKIMSFPLRWNWKPQPHRIVTKEIRFNRSSWRKEWSGSMLRTKQFIIRLIDVFAFGFDHPS